MEIEVKKVGTSQHGPYILDTNGDFTSTTSQVVGFLSSQVPCTIESTERDGAKITRVRVVKKGESMLENNSPQQTRTLEQRKHIIKSGLTDGQLQRLLDENSNSIAAQTHFDGETGLWAVAIWMSK